MDYSEIIRNQSKALSHLFEELEVAHLHSGMRPWYVHVPPTRNIPMAVKNSDLIPKCYTTLKFSDDFLALLSLDTMAQLGTWGRYKVLIEETFSNITPSQDRYLFVLHCNMHTEKERQDTIESIYKKMASRIKNCGIKDVVVVSTNQNTLPEDTIYVRKIHRSFTHWSPYTTAYEMKKFFVQYPKSFVVTSNYVGSLLLDNELFFNMNFRFHPDSIPSIACAFEDVCTFIEKNDL